MTSDSFEFLDLPEDFRQDIFAKIFTAIGRHESMTLLAPPGMGKTLTLQLLTKKLNNGNYIDLNSLWQKNIDVSKPQVLILDHAENISDQLYFKSVRETARDKISFVFAISGHKIPEGPLHSIFLENIVILGPLNETDANIFLEKCLQLFEIKLTPKQKAEILKLAGGVPRIIKRLGKLFGDKADLDNDPKLQNDIKEIQEFLRASPQNWTVPILDSSTPTVETVGEINFSENLSKQEYLLVRILTENKGQLVTREQMIEAVWQSKMYDINEHALDQMIHRLREKLNSATPKAQLATYRGRGCKLNLS